MKYTLVAVTIITLATVSVLYVFGPADNPGFDSDVSWQNEITVEKNSNDLDKTYNKLTEQGKQVIANKLFNNSLNNTAYTRKSFTYISLGQGSAISAEDVRVDEELNQYNLSRKEAGFIDSSSVGTYTLKAKYKADLPNNTEEVNVNTTGLYYNESGPSLISGGDFSNASLEDGDRLTVTHRITISGN